MTYIERLQNDKALLTTFYKTYLEVEDAEYKYENTAYKGDADKARIQAHNRLNQLKYDVETMLSNDEKKEAVKNA